MDIFSQYTSGQLIWYYIMMFMIFSAVGWLMEVSLKYIQFHRFINRGFLIGPVCPIYGTGAVLVTVVVNFLSKSDGYFVTFLISFFFCSALEYFVSWYMEKMFHARWWDYSDRPMNLEGRIWIGNCFLFGIGGMIIVKLVVPALFHLFSCIPQRLLHTLCIVFCALMIVDYVCSHIITSMVRHVGEASKGDDTEQISLEIRRILSQKSFLHRRILDAYPNMQARTAAIQKRLQDERHRLQARIREERRRLYNRSN